MGRPAIECPDPARLGENATVLLAEWSVSRSTLSGWRRRFGVRGQAGASHCGSAEKIAWLRAHPELGHAEAGRALGLSRQAVQSLRSRHRLPTTAPLEQLAELVAAHPDDARRLVAALSRTAPPADGPALGRPADPACAPTPPQDTE